MNNKFTQIKWWEKFIIWFLPMHRQFDNGFIFYSKVWRGKTFILKGEQKKIPTKKTYDELTLRIPAFKRIHI